MQRLLLRLTLLLGLLALGAGNASAMPLTDASVNDPPVIEEPVIDEPITTCPVFLFPIGDQGEVGELGPLTDVSTGESNGVGCVPAVSEPDPITALGGAGRWVAEAGPLW